jgi:SAM-dependent methyltransferase
VELLHLPADAQVVDIACGKGEFLIRLAEVYDARGVGIDLSPFFVADAERRLETRASDAGITFIQMNGADFSPDNPHQFDLASCIGASWIFGGHAGTLEALIRMVKPDGWVIVGEPYWLQEPPQEYLEAAGIAKEDLGSHVSNAEVGEHRGLDLVHTIVSSSDDWDVYEGLQWYAAAEYARAHPDDPDLAEVVERVEEDRKTYLRWGRDTVGWAIYMFRRRAHGLPDGASRA